MQRILHQALIVSILIMFLHGSIGAQETLSETYISPDDSFSFHYPSGWSLADYGFEIVLSNSEQTAFSRENLLLQQGEIQIRVISPAAVALYMASNEGFVAGRVENAVWGLMHDHLEETQNELNNIQVSYSTISNHTAYVMSATDARQYQAVIFAINVEAQNYTIVLAITRIDNWKLLESLPLTIAETISYTSPEFIQRPNAELPMEKTLVFDGNRLSLNYPANWTLFSDGYQNIVTNTPWTPVNLAQDASLAAGQFFAIIIPPSDIQKMLPNGADLESDEYLVEIARKLSEKDDPVKETLLHGRSTILVRGSTSFAAGMELETDINYFVVVIEVQPKEAVALTVYYLSGMQSQIEEIFLKIADTIQASA